VSSHRTVAVVVPVRDGAPDLKLALATIVPQAAAAGGDVIVVDDASTDESAAIAEAAGARVVRLTERSGPYVARNAGWRASTAAIIVFTDVRNRAEPRWLETILAPLADPSVAIVGGTVVMAGGRRVAERWARYVQLLDVETRSQSDWLPYVPTASMAVRRSVLERLDGFRAVRSAGDVDLCWRAQLAGLGTVAIAPDSVMVCDPRASVPEVLRQWTRYGYSNYDVRSRFGADGCPPPTPRSRRAGVVGAARAVGGALLHRRDVAVALLDQARVAAYNRAHRKAAVSARRAAKP
jgi:cellulose synthase/poly-beta-1,6-N-acetylglucosamine synthase-like glycosyltransferase